MTKKPALNIGGALTDIIIFDRNSGHINGNGATEANMLETGGRLPSAEVWEGRNPWFFVHNELAPDSRGAGTIRTTLPASSGASRMPIGNIE